jgi:hypothetical protein
MKKFLLNFLLIASTAMAMGQTTVLRPDNLQIGQGADNKQIIFDKGSGASNPRFKWDNSTSKLQFSDDGSTFINLDRTPVISSKTSNYTTTDTDSIVYVDGSGGAFNITLHTPISNQQLILYRTETTLANAVSIVGTISGVSNYKLHTAGEVYVLQYSTALATWTRLYHSAKTPWSSETTITIGATTTPPTKGTTTIDSLKWYRDGEYAYVMWRYRQSADTGAANGSGDYLFTLPTGLVINTTQTGTFTSVEGWNSYMDMSSAMVGEGHLGASDLLMIGHLSVYSTTQLRFFGQALAAGGIWGSGMGYFTSGALPKWFLFTAKVPIQDWVN